MSDPNRLWRSRVHSVWGQFQAQLAANHQEVLDSGGLPEKHAHSALMSLCQRSSPSGINTCVRPHFLEQLHPEHPVRLGTEADTRKPPVQPDAEELLTARSRAHSLTATAPQVSALTALQESQRCAGARLGAAPGPGNHLQDGLIVY